MMLSRLQEPMSESRSRPLSGSDSPRLGQLVFPLLSYEPWGLFLSPSSSVPDAVASEAWVLELLW